MLDPSRSADLDVQEDDGFELLDCYSIEEDVYLSNLIYGRTEVEEDTILRLQTNSVIQIDENYYKPVSNTPPRSSTEVSYTTEEMNAFIENVLQHTVYLFSGTTDRRDVRELTYAPVYVLFGRLGYQLTIPREVIQEYIDLFRTLKMMIQKVEKEKLIIGWDYPEWSKDMTRLRMEIEAFFEFLYQKPRPSVLDGYTVIEYNPNYYLNRPDRVLRPSERECHREIKAQMNQPRSISIHAIDIIWILDFFRIIYRYLNPRPPTSVIEILYQIQRSFDDIQFGDQQSLIAICEDVLGGLSLEHISVNLEKWIHLNRDIVPSSIQDLLYPRRQYTLG
jgi:hypothetical protein